MATTYVYLDSDVSHDISIDLKHLGPRVGNANLTTQVISPRQQSIEIMTIPRFIAIGVYNLDVAFSLPEGYVASLQVLMKGHAPGSMIWWRWRTATAQIGAWVTDHNPHATTVTLGGTPYTFTIQGQATRGYDDILVKLAG